MKRQTLTLIAACTLWSFPALAANNPDARLKNFTYDENRVYTLTGHYGITSLIQFDEYEQIETISIGDSESWQVTPSARGNLLFIKPILEQAETNLSVVTDKRIYSFALKSSLADSLAADELNFRIKFSYQNDTEDLAQANVSPRVSASNISFAPLKSENLNHEYSFAGDQALKPLKMFDDGTFTYLRFDEYLALPAVFAVEADGTESLVNFNMHGPYMRIFGIFRQFTLRSGKTATCIFNDAHPGKEKRASKTKNALSDKPASSEKSWVMASNGYPIPPHKPKRGLMAVLSSIF